VGRQPVVRVELDVAAVLDGSVARRSDAHPGRHHVRGGRRQLAGRRRRPAKSRDANSNQPLPVQPGRRRPALRSHRHALLTHHGRQRQLDLQRRRLQGNNNDNISI